MTANQLNRKQQEAVHGKSAKKHRRPKEGMVEDFSIGSIVADVIVICILLVVMFCCIIPLWHTIMASISDGKVLLGYEGAVFLPVGEATMEGYEIVFQNPSILRGYLNTLLYVAGNCALGFCINVVGGYVLSRKSRLKPFMTLFIVISTMFSGGTVPLYMVVRTLGMTGTPLSLIVPYCTNAMFVILVMNAFNSVPESTVEAAMIDGAGHLRTMFQVVLPQSMGMVIVTVINTAIMTWNEWFHASIYIPTAQEWWPLQLWIREFVSKSTDFLQYANPNYARYLVQYCVIVIATLPVLVVFPFFQKRLEKGVAMGAVKE